MFSKRLLAGSLIFAVLLLASGCQLLKGDSISTADVFKNQIATRTGFYGEKFIPKDAVAVVSLDLQDVGQGQTFDKLRQKFVDDQKWTELKEQAYAEFDDDRLKEAGMTFKDDVMGVFGDNPRVVLAVDKQGLKTIMSSSSASYYNPLLELPVETSPVESSTLSPEDGLAGAASSEEEVDYTTESGDGLLPEVTATEKPFEGAFFIVAKIENTEKYNKFMQFLVDQNDVTKVENQDMEMWKFEENVYSSRYQDMMVVSSSVENVKAAVQRAKTGEDNITDNENFREFFGHVGYPHLMYMYEDTQASLEVTLAGLNEASVDASEQQKLVSKAMEDIYKNFMGFVKFDGAAVFLEDGGLRLKSYTAADETKLKSEDKGFETWKGELALLKKVPGEGMALYEEIGSGYLEMASGLIAGVLPVAGVDLVEFKTQFKALSGLDWDKDVASFLKKDLAFYMGDSGELVPTFGFMVDASQDPAAAGRVMDMLNSWVDVGLTGLRASLTPDQATLVEKTKVNLAGKDVNKVSLDFSKLSEESLAALSLDDTVRTAKLEFYYGVTGDNVALLSLQKGLDLAYGKDTMSSSEAYKTALNSIGEEYQDGAVVYFNMAPVWSYADRLFTLMNSIPEYDDEGKLIEKENADQKDYEEFKKYAQPVKYFIMGQKMTKTVAEANLFLSIQ